MGLVESNRNDVLDKIFRGNDFSIATPVEVSLHTGDPGSTGANEVAGNGYSRVSMATTDWNAPANGAITNGVRMEWADMPNASVSHIGIFDANGNFIWGGTLSATREVADGQTVVFLDGELEVPTSGR